MDMQLKRRYWQELQDRIKHKYGSQFTNDGKTSNVEGALEALEQRAAQLAYNYGIINQKGHTPLDSDDNFMSDYQSILSDFYAIPFGSSVYSRSILVTVSGTKNLLNQGRKIKMVRQTHNGIISPLANFYIGNEKIFVDPLGGVLPEKVTFWLNAVTNLFLHSDYFKLYDGNDDLESSSLTHEEIAFFMLKGYSFTKPNQYYKISVPYFNTPQLSIGGEKMPSYESINNDIDSDGEFVFNTL